MVDLDRWIEKVKRCEYLAEDELKALCEYVSVGWPSSLAPCLAPPLLLCGASLLRPVDRLLCLGLQVKEILVEESNVQPVQAPVTVGSCGAAAACLRQQAISSTRYFMPHTRVIWLAQEGNSTCSH